MCTENMFLCSAEAEMFFLWCLEFAPGACIILAIPRSSMYVATPVQNLFSGRKEDMQSKIWKLCCVFIIGMLPFISSLPMKFFSDSMNFILPLRPMIIMRDSQYIDAVFGKRPAVYHTYEPGNYFDTFEIKIYDSAPPHRKQSE